MKKRIERQKKNYIMAGILAAAAVGAGVCLRQPLTAEATGSAIRDIETSINKHENELGALNNQISDMEDVKSLLQEEIDDLTSEITNTITSIELKKDEIAEKEAEIEDKNVQIEETRAEYKAAVEREEKQRESMVVYMRMIYEQGDYTYIGALLEGKGLADILNRMGYIERVYEYANQLLENYINAKNDVQNLCSRLEEEERELQEDKRRLDEDYLSLENQNNSLNGLLEQKKKTSANYEAEIAKARQEAAAAKTLIQQEKNKLKSLQAQLQREQAAANAAGANYSAGNYSSVIDNASGSELGKQVARFACQYIGNPYVYGGTSLTNGADCSGFTYRVYSHFGYGLQRTSLAQRSDGSSVSYQEAEPGDILCYEGHVGIYIGGGLIVHASNSNPYPSGGIKVSSAQYREILAVRRII